MRHPWIALAGLLLAGPLSAQELEPGAYTVSAAGINFAGASYSLNVGEVAVEPASPIEDAKATINTVAFSLGRAINLAGRSATVLVGLPVVSADLEGRYLGTFGTLQRTGLGDARLRLGVNLYGSPAMTLPELVRHRQRTNLGASLSVVAPIGQYDTSRLINLSAHRWSFKPELGLTHTSGRWTYEIYGGVWLFTDNDNFFGGRVKTQKPIGSAQLHVRYVFRPGLWTAFNINYYTGGRTSVDGRLNFDFQRNSRVGATLAVPLNRHHAMRFTISRGAVTTIGADFTGLSAGYQYVWGAGL